MASLISNIHVHDEPQVSWSIMQEVISTAALSDLNSSWHRLHWTIGDALLLGHRGKPGWARRLRIWGAWHARIVTSPDHGSQIFNNGNAFLVADGV